ncbi:WD40-repeat-containing domain protein [Dichotomocladium elegans]|nr:WD40-repeat-containing domain protein [Dichotomocladium elegans]
MGHRIPFTTIAHNPVKPEIALANGKNFFVINSSNGQIIKPSGSEADLQQKEFIDLHRSMSFSSDGTQLAVTGEDKKINVYDCNDWSLKYTREAAKRVNALQFTKDNSKIVIADKFGDVYSHPAEESNGDTKLAPILGHVSMITDMTLSADEKFVITADRDEHIRVSRFPNGYNIESFCLGHTDVVTNIAVIPWAPEIMISAGGDGTIRLWNFVLGKQLQSLEIKEYIGHYSPEATDANSKEPIVSQLIFNSQKTIAVLFAKTPAVLLFDWTDDNRIVYKQTLETSIPALSACFDSQGDLWVSLAPSNENTDLVTIFEGRKFERVAGDDERITKVNAIQVGLG